MNFLNIQKTDEGVTYLTLNRPEKKNALSIDLVEELGNNLDSIQDSKVLVFKGEGGFFSAGADISMFESLTGSEAEVFSRKGNEVMDKIQNFGAITVAVIEGGAYGGGLELALSCDIRIASPNVKLGLTEINLGILPGWGGMKRLSVIAGRGTAKYLALTGKVIDGKEAYHLGILSVLSDDPLVYSRELITALSKKSKESIRRIKELLNREQYSSELESRFFGEIIETDFAKAAVQKFLKR